MIQCISVGVKCKGICSTFLTLARIFVVYRKRLTSYKKPVWTQIQYRAAWSWHCGFFDPRTKSKPCCPVDAGVHALHSTIHVDLERNDGKPYDTDILTGVLNRTLDKQNLPIRILSSQRVVDSFHCRYHAIGRTYLYRVAVSKNVVGDSERSSLNNKGYETFVPVEEIDRCFFVYNNNFNIERLRGAARMFLGVHDFRTFMSVSRQKSPSRDHPMFTVRKIDEINIRSGQSLAVGHNATLATQTYDYWDIEIKAKSFLYKQVRRIVGTLLALANSRIDERCIYQMLTIPSKHSWDSRVVVAPAHGLYLCRVHYRDTAFNLPDKSSH